MDVSNVDGTLLDSRTLTNFANGAYLIWDLSGAVRLQVTNLLSVRQAVVSGLFIDSAGP